MARKANAAPQACTVTTFGMHAIMGGTYSHPSAWSDAQYAATQVGAAGVAALAAWLATLTPLQYAHALSAVHRVLQHSHPAAWPCAGAPAAALQAFANAL